MLVGVLGEVECEQVALALGQPLVLFLASDAASFVTGAEYVVDGGALAG